MEKFTKNNVKHIFRFPSEISFYLNIRFLLINSSLIIREKNGKIRGCSYLLVIKKLFIERKYCNGKS